MIMKKYSLLFILTCVFACAGYSQIHRPVTWSVASKKLNDKEAVVFIKAAIQTGWHIYGMHVPEGGPIATQFSFESSKDFALNGNSLEPKPKTKFEEVFKMNVPYHNGEVIFQQKVKLNGKKATSISGTVEFMACDKNQCLPPDEYSFTVSIK